LESEYQELTELEKLARSQKDDETLTQAESALATLAKKVESALLESLLNQAGDQCHCYLEVHSGAGGVDAQDWGEILLRMYQRWAMAKGYEAEQVDETPGEEAGIKSAILKIKGENAYGWLKGESGVHRLVRISPFDSSSRRHTSFASVSAYPVPDEAAAMKVEINPSDLKIDTFRASGAGGQHVNKTESAVRITHIPLNIIVKCQNSRSQHRNKATAMDMLKARILESQLRLENEKTRQIHQNKDDIGWGSQIRSYVLHPYKMVKDLRTNLEIGDANKVLEGGIEPFLEAALAAK